ncbi:LON peptidase substrate-binding domain-containing protein, partial [bacterium]|nr:LON peptidase substrate-binding domain-containing protein [bacterium]
MPIKKTAAKKNTKKTTAKIRNTKTKKAAAKPLSEFPLLPLRDVVIFPGMIMPLFVGRPKSVAALEAGMQGGKQIVLTAQKKMEVDEPKADELYP